VSAIDTKAMKVVANIPVARCPSASTRWRCVRKRAYIMRAGLLALMVAVAANLQAATASAQSPDYEFFKARVEPIFLKKKPGHTRCYVCHAESNNAFRLEKLPPGAKFWTE